MHSKDLEIFNQMPFLFWVKDAEGRYIWGNKVINELANEDVVGKTLAELDFSGRTGCYIARLHRGNQVRTPDASTRLELGDHLMARGRFAGSFKTSWSTSLRCSSSPRPVRSRAPRAWTFGTDRWSSR